MKKQIKDKKTPETYVLDKTFNLLENKHLFPKWLQTIVKKNETA